jgi:signal transduction histidine kinase
MQTAATAPDQVREGIEAGAYYYLAKPYEPETLTAIVRAALVDIDVRENAHQEAQAHVKAMELLDRAEFRFRSLDQIGPLIQVLASLCATPEIVASGLSELLVNAVEHGNLGISYADKKRLRLENTWEAEVARRLALPEYRDRNVLVRVARLPDHLEFTVIDEGTGFDWQRYLDFEPERATDPNGRGIAMARMLSFASLQYSGCGNTVIATVPA